MADGCLVSTSLDIFCMSQSLNLKNIHITIDNPYTGKNTQDTFGRNPNLPADQVISEDRLVSVKSNQTQ